MIAEISEITFSAASRLAYQNTGVPQKTADSQLRRFLKTRCSFGAVYQDLATGQVLGVITGLILTQTQVYNFVKAEEPFLHNWLEKADSSSGFGAADSLICSQESQYLWIGHFAWESSISLEVSETVRIGLSDRFVSVYSGLNIVGILCETHGEVLKALASSAGFKPFVCYQDWDLKYVQHHLMILTKDSATESQNMQLLKMFQYRPRRLKFSLAEVEVLREALSFDELQNDKKSCRKKSSTDAAWRRIFEKFRVISNYNDGITRQAVLSYVRLHPWELWVTFNGET